MKLSTKGRYGLKAMFQLSLNQSNGPIPLKNIASKQNISEQYLEQIFSSLKNLDQFKVLEELKADIYYQKNLKI